jgi:hypothetical protein
MKKINTKKYIKKIAQVKELEETEEDLYKPQRERRFRASIYVDIFVPETNDLVRDRANAESQVKEYTDQIPNSYIGAVAFYNPLKGLDPLDRDI